MCIASLLTLSLLLFSVFFFFFGFFFIKMFHFFYFSRWIWLSLSNNNNNKMNEKKKLCVYLILFAWVVSFALSLACSLFSIVSHTCSHSLVTLNACFIISLFWYVCTCVLSKAKRSNDYFILFFHSIVDLYTIDNRHIQL